MKKTFSFFSALSFTFLFVFTHNASAQLQVCTPSAYSKNIETSIGTFAVARGKVKFGSKGEYLTAAPDTFMQVTAVNKTIIDNYGKLDFKRAPIDLFTVFPCDVSGYIHIVDVKDCNGFVVVELQSDVAGAEPQFAIVYATNKGNKMLYQCVRKFAPDKH